MLDIHDKRVGDTTEREISETKLLCAEVSAALILCKFSMEAWKKTEVFEQGKSHETPFLSKVRSPPWYTADGSGTTPHQNMCKLGCRSKRRRRAMRTRRDDKGQPPSMVFDRQQLLLPLPTISKTAFPRDYGIRLRVQSGKERWMLPSKSFNPNNDRKPYLIVKLQGKTDMML